MFRCSLVRFPSLLVLCALFLATSLAHGASQEVSPPPKSQSASRWKGVLSANGVELGFSVMLDFEKRSGTIDIPLQQVKGAALTDVSRTEKRITFTLAFPGQPRAIFEATIDAGGESATGNMSQSGMTIPFTLERLGEGEAAPGLVRPQTPKPPFPYAEEAFVVERGAVTLAGTLTLPAGEGPHPAVLLLSGSGGQDRNQELRGHQPFWVIADRLSRNGIAVLRVDDRGVGESTGDLSQASNEDLRADAQSLLEKLRAHTKVDGARVGLLGHSEGGVIAGMVAAADPKVAFVVLLSSPVLEGRELMALQLEKILLASGVPEALVKRQVRAQQEAFEGLANDDRDAIANGVRKLILLQTFGSPTPPPPEMRDSIEQQVAAQVELFLTPRFSGFVLCDPMETLVDTKAPILALFGALDVQVPAEPNQERLKEEMPKEGPTPEVVVFPGLNHLFQTARTGLPQEYATIEETISPAVLEKITAWITARTSK